MNANDQLKLLKAHYTIIRADNTREPVIKAKTPDQHEWHVFKKGYPSKVARDREMTELLKLSKVIED